MPARRCSTYGAPESGPLRCVRWCDSQSQMATFSGICRVHRAAMLQLHGAWPAAVEEARQACARSGPGEASAGAGRYREAEIQRLRGAFADAEQAYRDASELGWQPQPGLALLRLAQGRDRRRRRRRSAGSFPKLRTGRDEPGILPAYVEIMLAAGDLATARGGSRRIGHDRNGLRMRSRVGHESLRQSARSSSPSITRAPR